MKTFGTFLLLLLGLAYGFEDNEFRQADLSIFHIINGRTRVIIGFNDLQNNEYFSTDKSNDEEIVTNSKFLHAIKRAKDNELKNISADELIMKTDKRKFLIKI